jgi:hypothetical protein
MNFRNLIIAAIFIISISINGCGLFGKKSPDNEKSDKQIMQEQDLKRKVDSLKNLKLDKELDSLKIVLDSSSKNLNESMQKLMKSGDLNKNNDQKIK